MKISTIGLGILASALLAGTASAVETDYSVGTKALPLQQEGATARSMAMGSAVVAVHENSASLFWNPAGLSQMQCSEVGFHHNSGLGDITQEMAVVGIPLGGVAPDAPGGKYGGLAASVGYVSYGSFSGRDTFGNPTGNYNSHNLSGSVGWGREIIPGLSGGLALKANQSTFGHQSYDSYTADFGFMYTPISALDLGLVYSNLNLGNKIGGNDPTAGWRLGAGWHVDRHWLLAASSELQDNAMTRLQFGTEYLIGNTTRDSSVLALRAGYVLNYPDPQLAGLTGLTLGLGYTITHAITVDYAFIPAGDLGSSHRVSLTFRFKCPGKCGSRKCAEEPRAEASQSAAPVVTPALVAAAAAASVPPPVVLKSIVLEDSHFDFDKATLKPEGMAALKENIELLKENPKTKVRVAGYTSMSGTPEYNQRLSERRAAAVEAFLIKEGGIAPGRISTIGYGETKPLAYERKPSDINSNAAKANMRVLFEISVK
ncbi:MAG: PorV/PorQ family protein [Elusimicrobiota bacterium]